jgi:tyrosinase
MPLNEQHGIDILGNIIEASNLSPNPDIYGNLHNMGHMAIAYCHDPDQRHLETFGVLGDTSTAMRDPMFYRWHAAIDALFMGHKDKLPRYTLPKVCVFIKSIHMTLLTKVVC